LQLGSPFLVCVRRTTTNNDELVAALERPGLNEIIPVSVAQSYHDALAVVASDTEKTTATKRGYHLGGAVITDHGGYIQGQALVK
jgi:hypothetical protein